jgi:hypothetical protein
MNLKNCKVRSVVALLATCTGTALAAPGIITTSLSPLGPVSIGNVFSVTFSISGYTDPTEIDGYNFLVAYAPIFSYVGGSAVINDAPGASENWLRLPPQDGVGAGPILSDFSTQLPGSIAVSVSDLRPTSTRGTTAASGFLYSFSLMANSVGIGSITPAAGSGGTGFFDVNFSPAGVPLFSGSSITVVPEPGTLALFALAGAGCLVFKLRRHT